MSFILHNTRPTGVSKEEYQDGISSGLQSRKRPEGAV